MFNGRLEILGLFPFEMRWRRKAFYKPFFYIDLFCFRSRSVFLWNSRTWLPHTTPVCIQCTTPFMMPGQLFETSVSPQLKNILTWSLRGLEEDLFTKALR